MGILSRFKDVMASNIHALLEKSEDPEQAVDAFMRQANIDLGQIKAETASVLADERRAKRALDECTEEIAKLQRYAEKAVEAGSDADARKFLEKKAPLVEKSARLQVSYDLAAANAASMKQMKDKLESDISGLEQRRLQLKTRMAAAKAQQRMNEAGSPVGGRDGSAFDKLEDQVNSAYYEAMAVAELRGEQKEDIDELFAEFEKQTGTSTKAEEERAVIKENKKPNE